MNVAFYYGSLVAEQLRALPLYTSLGSQYDVDCLSTPVSADTSNACSVSPCWSRQLQNGVCEPFARGLGSKWPLLLIVSSLRLESVLPWPSS